MGIGMALLEHTSYDRQSGAPINSNLADYVVAVNADTPPIEVHFLDYLDKEINELGARRIGDWFGGPRACDHCGGPPCFGSSREGIANQD